MTQDGFKRKLTAILSADAVGYSRLMRKDESATVRDITAHRALISEIIQQQHGRVIDSPGDNILAEFASVVDAVNGAIKIQEEIKKSNTEIPEDRRMEFRIGINIGDVIEEENRIYGDGVNIAARVEGLAVGGGIAISGMVYDSIKDKLSLGYHYLGEQDVKNIPEPVRIYRLMTEPADAGKIIGEEKTKSNKLFWAAAGAIVLIILGLCTVTIKNYYFRTSFEPASVEKMAFPLPEKPSIAVLPFDNMSGDPGQLYFCDGISENIISALSKISEIFVISRNSTFTYKGKPTKAQHVAEELGVQYILEGSVQKSEDQIRVTAQLIDATAGIHIWSDRYDRSIDDLFEVQDDITHEIIVALQIELTDGEQALIRYKSTKDLDAWSYAVRGMSLFERLNKVDNEKAKKLFERAVEKDPDYTWAWTMLAWTYLMEAKDGYVHLDDRGKSIKRSLEISQNILKADVKDPEIHTLLGLIFLYERQHDKAIAEGEKAVALGPNNADVHALFANILRFSGKFQKAIKNIQEAMRISPHHRGWYLWELGLCYYYLGRYEEMLEIGQKYLKMAENRGIRNMAFGGHFLSSLSLVRLGKIDEARSHIKEVLKIYPFYSIWFDRQVSYYKNSKDLENQHQDLRKAGLPEYPPS